MNTHPPSPGNPMRQHARQMEGRQLCEFLHGTRWTPVEAISTTKRYLASKYVCLDVIHCPMMQHAADIHKRDGMAGLGCITSSGTQPRHQMMHGSGIRNEHLHLPHRWSLWHPVQLCLHGQQVPGCYRDALAAPAVSPVVTYFPFSRFLCRPAGYGDHIYTWGGGSRLVSTWYCLTLGNLLALHLTSAVHLGIYQEIGYWGIALTTICLF